MKLKDKNLSSERKRELERMWCSLDFVSRKCTTKNHLGNKVLMNVQLHSILHIRWQDYIVDIEVLAEFVWRPSLQLLWVGHVRRSCSGQENGCDTGTCWRYSWRSPASSQTPRRRRRCGFTNNMDFGACYSGCWGETTEKLKTSTWEADFAITLGSFTCSSCHQCCRWRAGFVSAHASLPESITKQEQCQATTDSRRICGQSTKEQP